MSVRRPPIVALSAARPQRPAAVLFAVGGIAVWLVALASLGVGVGHAQDVPDEPPKWAYRIAHDLMSPYCPGRTLAECPSPQADELRLWILMQAAAGSTEAEVEQALYERFGDQILSAPRAEGWGLSAYLLPIGGFLLGGGLIAVALRRLVRGAGQDAGASVPGSPRSAAPGAPSAPASDEELERLLDEELARD